jgi:mannose-6-phosphate isomerase-like protein (cupin superfamily)
MIIRKDSLKPIDFFGLKIYDFTAGFESRSSFAIVQVLPHSKHKEAWSTRSDKFYYVLNGEIQFILENKEFILSKDDFLVVLKGQHFSYKNVQKSGATLILIHTPSFDIKFERFKE